MLNFKYEIPVSPRDTTVSFQYQRFDFAVKEAPFDVLDIKNKAQILGVSVRHPVYRTAEQNSPFLSRASMSVTKVYVGWGSVRADRRISERKIPSHGTPVRPGIFSTLNGTGGVQSLSRFP